MPVNDYWGTESTELEVDEAAEVDLEGNPVVVGVDRDIPKSIIDAKGDLIVGGGVDSPRRMAAGSEGQALVVDPSTETGLNWTTPASAEHVHDVYATDDDLAAHAADTTDVHGIADTSQLALTGHTHAHDHDIDYEPLGAVDTHNDDWTNVHGIADTQALATDAEVATAVSNHEAAPDPHADYVLEVDFQTHATDNDLHGGSGGVDIPQQDEPPASPAADDLWIDTDEISLGSPIAGASTLGYAQATANQGSIGATEVDVTGLTVTVTVPAGRRLRITAQMRHNQTTSGAQDILYLYRDASIIQLGTFVFSGAQETIEFEAVDMPDAGTHTYKIRAQASSGTMTAVGSSTNPMLLLVEDITGTVWPSGQSISRGMLPIIPACRVFNNANLSIPNATTTAVTFNSELFDVDDMHNLSTLTERITVNTAGIYAVTAQALFASNATGTRTVVIGLNAGPNDIAVQRGPAISGSDSFVSVTTLWKASAGDYFRMFVNQTSGGALNLLHAAGHYYTAFMAHYVGPG